MAIAEGCRQKNRFAVICAGHEGPESPEGPSYGDRADSLTAGTAKRRLPAASLTPPCAAVRRRSTTLLPPAGRRNASSGLVTTEVYRAAICHRRRATAPGRSELWRSCRALAVRRPFDRSPASGTDRLCSAESPAQPVSTGHLPGGTFHHQSGSGADIPAGRCRDR